jgi:hypothetical protein
MTRIDHAEGRARMAATVTASGAIVQGEGLTLATAGVQSSFLISSHDRIDLSGLGAIELALEYLSENSEDEIVTEVPETVVLYEETALVIKYCAPTKSGQYRLSVQVDVAFAACVSPSSTAHEMCWGFSVQPVILTVFNARPSASTSFIVLKPQCGTDTLPVSSRPASDCKCPAGFIESEGRCHACANRLSPWFLQSFCPTSSEHTVRAGTFEFNIYSRDAWGNAAHAEAGTCPFLVSASTIRQGDSERKLPSSALTCAGKGVEKIEVRGRQPVSAVVSTVFVNVADAVCIQVNAISTGAHAERAQPGGSQNAQCTDNSEASAVTHISGSPLLLVVSVPATDVCAHKSTARILASASSSSLRTRDSTLGTQFCMLY